MNLVRTAEQNGQLHIRLQGEVTPSGMLLQEDPFVETFGEEVYGRVVILDLGHVDLLNSAGLNFLLSSNKRFESKGGRLILHSMPTQVKQVMQLLSVARVFEIAPDRPAAQELAKESQA